MFKHRDHVFGAVETKMTRLPLKEIYKTSPWLADGWLDDGEKPFAAGTKPGLMYVLGKPDEQKANKQGWEAHEVWGYADVDIGGKKERKWIRKVHFTSKDVNQDLTLVWDPIDDVPADDVPPA